MRLLVTGSREWPMPSYVESWLTYYLYSASGMLVKPFTLVHGACPVGADAHADIWGRRKILEMTPGFTVERHPAEWEKYGRSAGFRRNAEMVNLGADLCLAFRYNESRGTMHTISLAEEAGIPVHKIELTERIPT